MKKLILILLLLISSASYPQQDEEYRTICKRMDHFISEINSLGWTISYDSFTTPLARAKALLVFYQIYLDTVKYDVSKDIISDLEHKIQYLRYAVGFLEKYRPQKKPLTNY